MNDASLSVPRADVARLARLAPYVGVLALLSLVMAGLGAYDAYGELTFYGVRQPARVPHLIVIYASFEILALLSAWRAAQTARRLGQLRHATAPVLIDALAKLYDTLRLLSAWVLFAVLAYAWLRFLPVH